MCYSVKLILEQLNNDVLRVIYRLMGVVFKTSRFKEGSKQYIGNYLVNDEHDPEGPSYNFYFKLSIHEDKLVLTTSLNDSVETKEFLFDMNDDAQFNDAIAILADMIISMYTGNETELPVIDPSKPKSKLMVAAEDAFIKEISHFQKIHTFDQYRFTLKDDTVFTTVLSEDSAARIFLGDYLHFDGKDICVINKRLIQ